MECSQHFIFLIAWFIAYKHTTQQKLVTQRRKGKGVIEKASWHECWSPACSWASGQV